MYGKRGKIQHKKTQKMLTMCTTDTSQMCARYTGTVFGPHHREWPRRIRTFYTHACIYICRTEQDNMQASGMYTEPLLVFLRFVVVRALLAAYEQFCTRNICGRSAMQPRIKVIMSQKTIIIILYIYFCCAYFIVYVCANIYGLYMHTGRASACMALKVLVTAELRANSQIYFRWFFGSLSVSNFLCWFLFGLLCQ